jgi:hypothetical protein
VSNTVSANVQSASRSCAPVVEAAAFAAAVILYVWILRFQWPWSIVLLVAGLVASLVGHSETLATMGLSLRASCSALSRWRFWVVLVLAAAALTAGRRAAFAELLSRGLIYLVWCIVQQVVYQTMTYRRLRAVWGPSRRTWLISGFLFASVHLPNPVLTPATFLWGGVSSFLFESEPSAPVLGLLQFLLSSILAWTTPVSWHRNFRVGAGYLHFHP